MTTAPTIAVTGASGQLGRIAIEGLKARTDAARLVALARRPEAVADLGIAARAADYAKPETLGPALAGVDTLVLVSSSDFSDRAGQHRNVIAAAKTAGVRHVIYTSILKGDASPMLIAADHAATEAAIREAGLAFTMLRNGWYTENWTGSLPAALAAGGMVGSAGKGRVSPAGRADFAEAVAVVAAGSGHEGRIYELAGDEAFTMDEMAAEVSRQTGRSIGYTSLPEAAYRDLLAGFGLPAGFAALIADADAKAAEGALLDESRTLSSLIGRPTLPMAEAVAAALG